MGFAKISFAVFLIDLASAANGGQVLWNVFKKFNRADEVYNDSRGASAGYYDSGSTPAYFDSDWDDDGNPNFYAWVHLSFDCQDELIVGESAIAIGTSLNIRMITMLGLSTLEPNVALFDVNEHVHFGVVERDESAYDEIEG